MGARWVWLMGLDQGPGWADWGGGVSRGSGPDLDQGGWQKTWGLQIRTFRKVGGGGCMDLAPPPECPAPSVLSPPPRLVLIWEDAPIPI